MLVTTRTFQRTGPNVAALVAALAFVASAWVRPAVAASSVDALLARAEHDTNTVRTLQYTDSRTITNSSLTVQVNARGAEDEVHNREQDSESVTVKTTGSKPKSLHYTVDINFMNGLTYYRTSFSPKKWLTHQGMTFTDPYAGGWKRGRTTISFPASVKFQKVGVSAGDTVVRASRASKGVATTIELWVSGGSTPYVVREDETQRATSGRPGNFSRVMKLGPFNRTLVIVPPSSGGTT